MNKNKIIKHIITNKFDSYNPCYNIQIFNGLLI